MQENTRNRDAANLLAWSRRAATPGSPRPRDEVLRQRRAAARAQGVVALLQRRPDLAGVHLPADLTAEAVRWSV
jgi:hypothetical protein